MTLSSSRRNQKSCEFKNSAIWPPPRTASTVNMSLLRLRTEMQAFPERSVLFGRPQAPPNRYSFTHWGADIILTALVPRRPMLREGLPRPLCLRELTQSTNHHDGAHHVVSELSARSPGGAAPHARSHRLRALPAGVTPRGPGVCHANF